MNITQTFVASFAPGMDIVAGAPALRDESGPLVRSIVQLHDVYFGKTAFTRKQRQAVEAARDSGKSFTALEIIEKRIAGVKPAAKKWDLRLELCGIRVGEDALDKIAKKKAAEAKQATPAKEGVEVIKRAGDLWSLKVTGDSDVIADMANAVGKTLDSAKRFFFSGKAAPRSTKLTNVIITLDDLVKVLYGDGSEVTLQMTNGATITGAKLVQSLLANNGLATLVHPVDGPVNLYRLQRFASPKQRLMALAENPKCAWPGCNVAGEDCQIHHLRAWIHGGETNPSNLATLCRYHNGVNEDDPNAPPRRFRMIRRQGLIEWQPPWANFSP